MKHVWFLVVVIAIGAVGAGIVLTINSAVEKVVSTLDENESATVQAIQLSTDATTEAITETAQTDNDWEYRVVSTFREQDTMESLTETANQLGSEGWEYVGYFMNNGTNARLTLFKRPVE